MIELRWGTPESPIKVQWANLAGPTVIEQQQTAPNPIAVIVATGSGTGVSTLEWSPPSAMATWAIPHNLRRYPSVTVVDSSKLVVEAEVTYLDENLIEIKFAFPTSGYAYIV